MPRTPESRRQSRSPRPPLDITFPATLPVTQRKDDIAEAIANHQVVIIAGETGSGKTTQIPKICLELGRGTRKLIGHTQPRRLAARTVAERIAEELGVELGQEVGYQVRFTAQTNRDTRVKLMTDGILLAEIQNDRLLRKYDTLIIDEAHERSLNIDFILGYLKQLLPQRPDLKVVITSATIDPERFSEHFGGAPIISVSGRTFPVEIRYRPLAAEPEADDEADDTPGEDRDPVDGICDAVLELSREAPGDILVFLPGEREIRDTADALEALVGRTPRLGGTEVLPLFGRLSMTEQHRIFQPGGRRRIVLATNVAETSLTVPGIKYVVDSGTARISRYSHRTKVQRLPIERVSQASANQRSGRCGRVSDGICIRLYSQEDFEGRPEFTDPEILRTNLAAVILQMLSMGFATSDQDLLRFPFVQPPHTRSISDGVNVLAELGALRRVKAGKGVPARTELTDVGRQVAQLPVDPRLARMVVEAKRLGCVQAVLVVAAALSIQDPRERPLEQRERAAELHKRFTDPTSDVMAVLNLWRYAQRKQAELSSSQFRRTCKAEFLNFLRIREWQDLYVQLRQISRQLGIEAPGLREELDPVGSEDAIHTAVLSGLLSHVGHWDERKREYQGARGSRFAIFPGSGLFKKNPEWVVSAELVETSRLWARMNVRIDPAWVESVAGDLLKRSHSEPHWEKNRGQVVAVEKATLFGLPIVTDRKVNYGRIDPELSRELFIRHALVEGQWRTRHEFFHHNRRLLREAEELEHRARRRDLVVDDETLFGFYDRRLPAEIVSERHFDQWWKHARHEDPKLLDFNPSLVLAEDADEVSAEDFPLQWTQGNFTFPLKYVFTAEDVRAPVSAGSRDPVPRGATPPFRDGVTVTLPLTVLNQVEDTGFDWLIPGVRHELVTAHIKAMPKVHRKNFVPAADVARLALAQLHDEHPHPPHLPPPSGAKPLPSFTAALGLALRRLKGVPVPDDAWRHEGLPEHLRMRFRVVDARGAFVDEGQDLGALKVRLAPKVREAIAASLAPRAKGPDAKGGGRKGRGASSAAPDAPANALEKSGLTDWSIGTLPRTVDQELAGHRVKGYPALVDESPTSVGVRVFETPELARWRHRQGIRRLLALKLPDPAPYVQQHLDNREKLAFATNPYGDVRKLIQDCALCAVGSLQDELAPDGLVWTEAEFEALFQKARAEAMDRTFEVVRLVAEVLTLARPVEKRLKGSVSLVLMNSLADVRSHLVSLVHPGFVSQAGWTMLRHYPRYLKALAKRLEKMEASPRKDQLGIHAVAPLEEEHRKQLEKVGDGPLPGQLAEVAWMLQEFRVSLFAQELGTAFSVSDKRIRKALAGV